MEDRRYGTDCEMKAARAAALWRRHYDQIKARKWQVCVAQNKACEHTLNQGVEALDPPVYGSVL